MNKLDFWSKGKSADLEPEIYIGNRTDGLADLIGFLPRIPPILGTAGGIFQQTMRMEES